MSELKVSLEETKDLLRPMLANYLTDRGISTREKISCINPRHEDGHPSMSYWEHGNVLKCFSCNMIADIFLCHAIFEGAPLDGAGFVRDNVGVLAKRYGIAWDEHSLSRVEIRKLLISKAYQAAADCIIRDGIWCDKEILKRGWDPIVCRDMRVGTVKDYGKFISALSESSGMPEKELEKIALNRKHFGPNKLTYTFFDAKGKVIGFQARNLDYEAGGSDVKCATTPAEFRYKNDAGMEFREANPLYKGKFTFYGLNTAVEETYKRLDLYEGPGSVVMANIHGHKNCGALCGTAFNRDLIKYLMDAGFSHLNLVLDADKTGRDKTLNFLEKLNPPSGCRITVSSMDFQDKEGNDPEDYIKHFGINKLISLKLEDLFDFSLRMVVESCDDSITPEQFCDKVMPIIVATENRIRQTQQIRALAEEASKLRTNLEPSELQESISEEVRRRREFESESFKGRVIKKIQDAGSVDQVLDICNDTVAQVENNFSKETKDRISNSSVGNRYIDLMARLSDPNAERGWVTGWKNVDDVLVELPRKECNFIVFGDPHHGKSAIELALELQYAKNEDMNKNLSVLHWGLDDGFELCAMRMLGSLSGLPKEIVSGGIANTEQAKLLRDSKEHLYHLLTTDRISIKDLSDIDNTRMAERWIQNTQQETGNDIIFVIDALNDVPSTYEKEYDKINGLIEWIGKISTAYRCSVIATAHTHKRQKTDKYGSGEPHQSNIKGNNKIEFTGKIIASVYNEVQDRGQEAKYGWKKAGEPRIMPAIKFNVIKNKTFLGNKGEIWFKMDEKSISVKPATKKDLELKNDNTPTLGLESIQEGPIISTHKTFDESSILPDATDLL